MSFRVSESGLTDDKVITLEDISTETRVEIYAFGALLNAFYVKQNEKERNIIYGFLDTNDAKEHITPLFQSAKLSPFVCRLKEGRYTFANHKYKIEKYYSQREAIHGLVYDAVFTLQESGVNNDSAFVTLAYDYNKSDSGFPFFYRAEITYQLQENNRLIVTTVVTNHSRSAIPVADGWHPYFTLAKKVNELRLSINTKEIVDFDNRLLPTGQFTPYTNFIKSRLVEDTVFDNCFVLDGKNQQPACSLADGETGIEVNIYAEKNYPYLQIFIPDNRDAIAIENLSSLPDSFNNTIGLTVLEPLESSEFIAVYEVKLNGEKSLQT